MHTVRTQLVTTTDINGIPISYILDYFSKSYILAMLYLSMEIN